MTELPKKIFYVCLFNLKDTFFDHFEGKLQVRKNFNRECRNDLDKVMSLETIVTSYINYG